jgi:hypothetical protein
LPYFGEVTHLCMPLNMVSMAIYVTLEGKIPRTPNTIKLETIQRKS